MRFCNVAFVLLSGLAIASAAAPYQNKWTVSANVTIASTISVVAGNAATCPATTDMFPVKIKDVAAAFSVQYKMSYKIVTNKVQGKKYLLVQRGCTAPTDAELTAASLIGVTTMDDITSTFTVPLTSVAVTSSTYFPVFHYMGEKQAIRLYTSPVMYSSDGCMQKQAADGHTLTKSATYVAANSAYGDAAVDALNIQATFGASYDSGKNLIIIDDTTEESFYNVGEWSEYIAAFFNQEAKVVGLADTALKRWMVESNGIKKQFSALKIQKKVLLLGGYFQGSQWYPDGWALPPCKKADVCPVAGAAADAKCGAERWCEIIRAAGGDPMNMDLPAKINPLPLGNWTMQGGGAREGITHSQLIAFAKDADVVIFKSATETAAAMAAILADMKGIKAVDNKMAFDNQGILYATGTGWDGKASVGNGIFEYGQIEPDVMLQDFIKMVDPAYNHKQVFFRNLLKGGIDGGAAMGQDVMCADKPGQAGCLQSSAAILAKCTDPSATDDALTYKPGGFYIEVVSTPAPVVVAPAAAKDTIHFVTLTVTMPYTKAEFEVEAVQNSYKKGVAAAAGTISANVEILGVVESRRRAGSVAVETKILATDAAGVTTLSSTLGSGDALLTKLNAALKAEGVKESTGVTDPVANATLDSAASSRGVPQAVIGAAVVLAVLLG